VALQHAPVLDETSAVTAAPAERVSPSVTFGHLLEGISKEHGIELKDILVIRHSYTPGGRMEIQTPEDLKDPQKILAYTRTQKFSTDCPYWVILISDGGRRSRLFGTYRNNGEVVQERTEMVLHTT
jgi:hypothetical protein